MFFTVFPVLCVSSPWLTCVTGSVYLLIPFIYFAHFPVLSLLPTTCLFSVSVSLFLFRFSNSIYKWSYVAFVWLSSLSITLSPPMLSKVASFHSFLWLSNIPLYECMCIFFIHSSIDGFLLLLLLSHFSPVRLHVIPETAAHQAPPSLGFSRQEHWSGLPFPSPMCESEKWKWSRSVVSDSSQPHGPQPTRLLHPWDFPGKSTGVGCHCLLQLMDS